MSNIQEKTMALVDAALADGTLVDEAGRLGLANEDRVIAELDARREERKASELGGDDSVIRSA